MENFAEKLSANDTLNDDSDVELLTTDAHSEIFLCEKGRESIGSLNSSTIESVNLMPEGLSIEPLTADNPIIRPNIISSLKDTDVKEFLRNQFGNGTNKELFLNISKENLFDFHSENIPIKHEIVRRDIKSLTTKTKHIFNFSKSNIVRKDLIFDSKIQPCKSTSKRKLVNPRKVHHINNYDIFRYNRVYEELSAYL